ncbi:MAG: AAA-like domain-containing protein [Deltaproteobacteria bacterium]|nr:AAA-like domain-containing protein [Deltaproteobacteria bacterium]
MTTRPTRRFNTVGVCDPLKHFMLPALPRLDVTDMVEGEFYFVIHAPRQSGKTTYLTALRDKINEDGKYYALYCSLEALDDVTDVETAMTSILNQINLSLKRSEIDAFVRISFPDDSLPQSDFSIKINKMLNYISVNIDKDLVVFFDEADCLAPGPLVPFLRQIRQGYNERNPSAAKFPRSLSLIGMRDIRDYIAQVSPDSESRGLASPFNIKKESLTLNNFTRDEILALYGQHTAETGQAFEPAAIDRAWHWTEGQPWLVNALADEAIVRQLGSDCSRTVSGSVIDLAAHDLILRNDTHFDSLRARLDEPRVRRVMEAVLIGAGSYPAELSGDDRQYAIDLGLLKKGQDGRLGDRPANPIYQEVILRLLTTGLDTGLPDGFGRKWMDEAGLDMDGLLKDFQVYWRENSTLMANKYAKKSSLVTSIGKALEKADVTVDNNAIWRDLFDDIKKTLTDQANEALAHLVLYAFLQSVLNGGADIKMEYALGRTRVDICVTYKGRRYPVEVKIKGVKTRAESIKQLSGYVDKCWASEGWLVVFDKDFGKPWDRKLSWETMGHEDKTIHVVGC